MAVINHAQLDILSSRRANMTNRNHDKIINGNKELVQNKATQSLENPEILKIPDEERHNDNARASAMLEPEFPRVNTENL